MKGIGDKLETEKRDHGRRESTFLACANEGWLSYSLTQETLEVIRYFFLGMKHQNNYAFDLGYIESCVFRAESGDVYKLNT